MKRVFLSIGLICLVVLAGCSSAPSAGELMSKAIKASSEELDSYQMEGKFELSIDTDSINSDDFNPLEMFNTISFDLDGVYQREPMQAELNMDVSLGQPGLSLDVPIVITENKLWLQIPALPLPIIPPESVGKYIELDLEQLQEEPLLDETSVDINGIDFETQQKLGMELLEIILEHFDQDEYFSLLSGDELDAYDQVEAEHFVQLSLAQGDIEQIISILVHDVLPDIYELVSEPEWSEVLGISEEDLAELEQLIEEIQEEEEEAVAELTESVRLQNLQLVFAINKDDHINYSKIDIAVDLKEDGSQGGWLTLGLFLESHFTNINEEQQFEHGIPSEQDVLTIEELIPMFIGPSF